MLFSLLITCLALRPGCIASAPDECHVLVCQRTIGTRNEIASSLHVRMCERFNDFFLHYSLYIHYILYTISCLIFTVRFVASFQSTVYTFI